MKNNFTLCHLHNIKRQLILTELQVNIRQNITLIGRAFQVNRAEH